jgi:hypothetical protein
MCSNPSPCQTKWLWNSQSPETTAAATAAHRTYPSSPAAATLQEKHKVSCPPQPKSHATFMQPCQCVLQHVHIHSTTSLSHHFPQSPSFNTTLRHLPSSSLPSSTTLRCLLLCDVLLYDVLLCDVKSHNYMCP